MIYTVTFNPAIDYVVHTEGMQAAQFSPIKFDATISLSRLGSLFVKTFSSNCCTIIPQKEGN